MKNTFIDIHFRIKASLYAGVVTKRSRRSMKQVFFIFSYMARTYRKVMKKLVASIAMWTFVVFIPVQISFAYSMYYPQQQYQLYWCGSYYSYSPCMQQYYYPSYQQYSQQYPYPTYTYYTYPSYQQYYYPSYSYYPNYGYNYNGNYNYNYNYNSNYNGGYWW